MAKTNANFRANGDVGVSPVQGVLQRQCACGNHVSGGGECESCKKKHEGTLQRVAANASPTSDVPPIVHEVLRSPGRPLDVGTRAFMEPRFGRDFSKVQVHTDAMAAESARAVNARAYTVGENVVFGARQFMPTDHSGRRLLAHELAHVMQQRSNQTAMQHSSLAISKPDDVSEREADQIADGVMGSSAASLQIGSGKSSGSGILQRTIGDGHDLQSARFAGDLVLEACFDNERLLQFGDSGPAVEKIQQALVDAGVPLPVFGVDGIFKSETQTAVQNYQRTHGLSPDGVVGPITIGSLDALFVTLGPTPIPVSPVPPPIPTPIPPTSKCGPDATDWFVLQVNTALTDPAVLAVQSDMAAADTLARRHGTTAAAVAEGGAATRVLAEEAKLSTFGPTPPVHNSTINAQLTAGGAIGGGAIALLTPTGPFDQRVIDTPRILLSINSAAAGWKALVETGARYDFKAHVMNHPTSAHCPEDGCVPREVGTITLCPGAASANCYESDLPGNLFYAVVGRHIGWSRNTLQLGSQLAELLDVTPRPARPVVTWDTPDDTRAIDLGFSLPLPLTRPALCSAVPPAHGGLSLPATSCDDCTELTTAAIK